MTSRPARIVFMGTPLFAAPSLRALIEGHHVVAVVTQPDKPRGRGLDTVPSPVKELATSKAIPVLEPTKLRDESFIHQLKVLAPEVIVVVAYGKILPRSILALPPGGCVNLHASLLPKYRGAAPINRAIINGEKETGNCTMLMDEGMDTGDVLLCERVPIGGDDTAEDLFKTLSTKGADLLRVTIDRLIEGSITPTPQDDSKATYAPMLKKEDGRIDWGKSAADIKNHLRGLYPWPGAFTAWKGTLKVHKGRVADAEFQSGAEPGTIIEVTKEGILVACGMGVFEITELQPENKKRMSAADFIKGYRLSKGERFA